MTRVEFTKNIVKLLQEMIDIGENPIIDFVKRSTEEQKRLFEAHLSKCDGVKNKSKHQSGLAMDIYFIDAKLGNLIDWHKIEDEKIKWHKRWEELGGKPIIDWDAPHFEG